METIFEEAKLETVEEVEKGEQNVLVEAVEEILAEVWEPLLVLTIVMLLFMTYSAITLANEFIQIEYIVHGLITLISTC